MNNPDTSTPLAEQLEQALARAEAAESELHAMRAQLHALADAVEEVGRDFTRSMNEAFERARQRVTQARPAAAKLQALPPEVPAQPCAEASP